MTWGKVDDKLHSSVKWRRASRTARGLWTTALSWCSDQENGGQVPTDMLRVLDGTKADALSLVRVGLWETTDDGYVFHDWDDHNPDTATVKASRAAKSKGGKEGNHVRWHVKKGLVVEGCEFCDDDSNESDSSSGSEHAVGSHSVLSSDSRGARRGRDSQKARNRHGSNDSESDNRSDSDRLSESGANPPEPDPTRPDTYLRKRDTGTPRNASASDEPEPHPQTEFDPKKILASAGLAQHEVHDFMVDLKANRANSVTRVVNALHRGGKLTARIAEWRSERDLATEAASRPKTGKRTTDDRVADAFAMAEEFRALEAGTNPNVIPLRQIEGA